MRPTGISAKYWIYLFVVIFGVPTLIDAWSVAIFLSIASCFGFVFAIAIANCLWANHRDEVQARAIHKAARAQASALAKISAEQVASQSAAQAKLWARYEASVVSTVSYDNTLIRSEFLITQHTAELTVRRRQLTTTSNYGLVDDSQWMQEVDFFINEVLADAEDDVKISPDRLWTLRCMIDTATAQFAVSRVSFSPDMDPIDYEQMVADSLADLGWQTRLTKASGDQGIDVIAEMHGKRVVIQCKRYSSAIGNSAVQEAFAGRSFENADYAAVVTNAEFTRSARQLADTTHVILLHHDELSKLELLIFGNVGTNTGATKHPSSSGASLMYMTPICYEQAVADGLKRLGWQTRLKKTTEDRYADVIAELQGKRVLIQCWGFMAPCVPTVEEISEAKSFEGADYAAIVSNADFAPSGHQLAKSVGVVLLGHDNLDQLERRTIGISAQQGVVIADAA